MRLADGTLWPIPVTLPVRRTRRALEGRTWRCATPTTSCSACLHRRGDLRLGPATRRRAGCSARPMRGTRSSPRCTAGARVNVSGRAARSSQLPRHYDFVELRLTPAADCATRLASARPPRTSSPSRRATPCTAPRGADQAGGRSRSTARSCSTRSVGPDQARRRRSLHARPHATRRWSSSYYEPDSRRARAAAAGHADGRARARRCWHAIIRRNHGANHFIVGRDHAGPGNDCDRQAVLRPLRRAGARWRRTSDEIGVSMVAFQRDGLPAGRGPLRGRSTRSRRARGPPTISGTQVRDEYLGKGLPLPEWFTPPGGGGRSSPRRTRRVTARACASGSPGLRGAGKSTTAEVLTRLLLEHGRQVTLLDGDVVRTHLSQGPGFSKEDRDANILRIGFVAAGDSAARRHRDLRRGQPLPRRRATRCARMVEADHFVEVFVRHAAGGLRGARRQGPLRKGPPRRDRGLHRRRRPLRAPGAPGARARHRRGERGGQCSPDRRPPARGGAFLVSPSGTPAPPV